MNPYVAPGTDLGGGDFDYVWVMLTNDLTQYHSGSAYAQVGVVTLPTSEAEQINFEYRMPTGYSQNLYDPNMQPAIGSTHTYKVLRTSGTTTTTKMTFYYDGTALYDQNGNIATYLVGFNPTQAQAYGETHTDASSMYGTISDPEVMSQTNIDYNGTWEQINTNGQATAQASGVYDPTNTPPGDYFKVDSEGWKVVSNNEIEIWDNGCPASVNQGSSQPDTVSSIQPGSYFDAAGSGTNQYIENGSNTTNGPFKLYMQTDGHLVLYDSRNYALWGPLGLTYPDYAEINSNDYFVLFEAWGGAAPFVVGPGSSGTYFRVNNDGNLVLCGDSSCSTVAWNAGTNWDSTNSALLYGHSLTAGHSIYSVAGGYHLTLTTSGNLVLYNSNGSSICSTGTSGATKLVMENDPTFQAGNYVGDLVLLDSNNNVVWYKNTGTNGSAAPYNDMVVNSNGHFYVRALDGTILWTSGSGTC